MEKDFKSILIASIIFLLVASCFQPISVAQGSKGHIIGAWDEVVEIVIEDETLIEMDVHVHIQDNEHEWWADEYRVYIYSESGVELGYYPHGYWKNLNGNDCWMTVSVSTNIDNLDEQYKIVLKEQGPPESVQDEQWMYSVDVLDSITFDGSGFSDEAQYYKWDFGDDSRTTIGSLEEKVYHSYWNADTYQFELTAWDENGNEIGSTTHTIPTGNPWSDSGIQSVKDELEDLAKKYSPVLYVADDPADPKKVKHNCPGPINQILDNSVLKQKSWSTDPIIDDDPSIGDLMAYSGDQYYLDENNHDDKGDDPTTYVHFRKENNRYFIQYYFFYYFNDGPGAGVFINNHEGDWEMIQLSFDSNYNPISATYSQHTDAPIANFNWGEKRDWRNVEKYIDGDKLTKHPIVYVSSGWGEHGEANSHANYFYKGDGPFTDYTDSCDKKIEFDPKNDLKFLPNLENDLSNDYGWIQFAGSWGVCGIFANDGPPGPAFGTFENSDTGDDTTYPRWVYPYEFEDGRLKDGHHATPGFEENLKYTEVTIGHPENTEEGIPVEITANLFYQEDDNLYPFSSKVLDLYIDGYYYGNEITNEHGRASFSYTPLISGDYNIKIVFKGLMESSSHYTWSDCTAKLSVYSPSLAIQSPTTSNPAKVGDPVNPNEFEAIVTTGSQSYAEDAFEITIGEKTALYRVYLIDEDKNYYLIITPPTQENEGAYDLEVSIPSVSTDIEQDAVIFSTGGNVDVMTVIDRSGSMSGSNIAAAKSASSLFVDLMNINDMIGVASFGDYGYLNYQLTEITSGTVKQQAKNAINSIYASGWTAMGSGLQQGYYQLVNNGDPTHPWSMILLSDGYHNYGISPYSVLPYIQNKNIRVFTVGLGSSVDQNLLQYIADYTGGEYYYSPGTSELTTIYQTVAGVVKGESIVKTGEGIVNVGDKVTETVIIESSVNTATFTLNWESGICDLELKRPDNSIVLPSDSDVLSHALGTYYETFTIDDPEDGIWVMEITRTHASSLKYSFTVTASTDVTFHLFTDKDDYYEDEPIHIMATLSNSGNPITDAYVDIVIDRPDGSFGYLTLFDDGYHGDGVSSDGVYANYYTNTDLSGSYNINGYAIGTLSNGAFMRETAKSVQVSGIPSGGLSATPSSWNTDILHNGEHIVGEFSIDSLSSSAESVSLTATDFIKDAEVISAENIIFAPETFGVPAGDSESFYTIIFVPDDAVTGDYTGNIIVTSTANSITIPITLSVIADNTPPTIDVLVPAPSQALQDGVTFEAEVTDLSGVDWVTYSIREPNGGLGNVIDPMFESMSAADMGSDIWQLLFDTVQLSDGYYLLLVETSDIHDNQGYETVVFSIRNWAVVELLPSTQNHKAGRTMPVKFSISVVEAVDPEEPFVWNEDLTILIYEKDHPGDILQESTYGDTSKDYRISSEEELYITNFKTIKKIPKTYVVEIWRNDMLLDSFEFETVK